MRSQRRKLAERWARFHEHEHRRRHHHKHKHPHLPIAAPRHVRVRLLRNTRKRKHPHMKATITYVDPATLADLTTPIPAGDLAFIEVQRSIDNGLTYEDAGHAPPGALQFVDDLTGLAPGDVLYKLNSVDTQTPPLTGPDSLIVKVTIPTPELQAIAPPTDVAASIA